MVQNLPAMQEAQETRVQSQNQEDALEKGMATDSSILPWRILFIIDFPGGTMVKNPPASTGGARDPGLVPGWENPLEESTATHSSILA